MPALKKQISKCTNIRSEPWLSSGVSQLAHPDKNMIGIIFQFCIRDVSTVMCVDCPNLHETLFPHVVPMLTARAVFISGAPF